MEGKKIEGRGYREGTIKTDKYSVYEGILRETGKYFCGFLAKDGVPAPEDPRSERFLSPDNPLAQGSHKDLWELGPFDSVELATKAAQDACERKSKIQAKLLEYEKELLALVAAGKFE